MKKSELISLIRETVHTILKEDNNGVSSYYVSIKRNYVDPYGNSGNFIVISDKKQAEKIKQHPAVDYVDMFGTPDNNIRNIPAGVRVNLKIRSIFTFPEAMNYLKELTKK